MQEQEKAMENYKEMKEMAEKIIRKRGNGR